MDAGNLDSRRATYSADSRDQIRPELSEKISRRHRAPSFFLFHSSILLLSVWTTNNSVTKLFSLKELISSTREFDDATCLDLKCNDNGAPRRGTGGCADGPTGGSTEMFRGCFPPR